MDEYLTRLVHEADRERERYWSKLDISSVAAYQKTIEAYRRAWSEFLSVPDTRSVPLKAKRELVKQFETYTAHRVWIDTLPGVQAYGILLVPKKNVGKRAAVIALHGHRGTPEIVTGMYDPEYLKNSAYREFGRTLVERGYIVWAPYIFSTYSEEDKPAEGPGAMGRDILQKKALITGRTIMGLEAAKLKRGIDFLGSLPEVDPERIGMYGLSKGGHYTLYTAALDTRIKAAVVSGWFNQRTRKLLAEKDGPGMFFITHIHRSEYYLKDLLNRFGDAELGWLIAPRPLLIENGTEDRAVLVKDAREEFGRVESVYRKLGLADRAKFAAFDGPHRIDGAEAFPFLDRWLEAER
jgi:dienelactone hydrolase